MKSIRCYCSNFIPLLIKSLVWGLTASTLSSCVAQPDRLTLSSGTTGGYYSRLSQQIINSADTTVGLTVRNLDSQGSQQNLQRLLNRQTDFTVAG